MERIDRQLAANADVTPLSGAGASLLKADVV